MSGDTPQHIECRLRTLKTFPLLAGARGRAATDLHLLVAVIQSFMRMGLALQDAIQELEINPLLVDGNRMAAVDLLVIPRMKTLT
jgi:acetate---CoA ligase (ADP-forming)